MTIAELNLVEPALSCAAKLAEICPATVFTSGRRSREAQAIAMAKDVMLERNFIERTYRDSVASRACQAWVDAHPEVLDLDGIAEGILGILLSLSDTEYFELTHHGTGEAFDVRPWSCPRPVFLATVTNFGGKALWHEGDLPRWHAEFKPGAAECP